MGICANDSGGQSVDDGATPFTMLQSALTHTANSNAHCVHALSFYLYECVIVIIMCDNNDGVSQHDVRFPFVYRCLSLSLTCAFFSILFSIQYSVEQCTIQNGDLITSHHVTFVLAAYPRYMWIAPKRCSHHSWAKRDVFCVVRA